MIRHSAILDYPMQNADPMLAELERCVSPETLVRPNELLAKHTTLRVGGPADVWVEPASDGDLAAIVRCCQARAVRFFVLGRGSNLLVRDGGYRGVAIRLAHPCFSRIEMDGTRLRCGAGAKLKLVAVEASHHAVSGLEFLEGIPGTVGGALRMNAGAMGSATFDRVESVRLMSHAGRIEERAGSDLQAGYRDCPRLRDHIVLSAVLRGVPGCREEIEARMNAFSAQRWKSQPAAPSAGCIFRNPVRPEPVPAGRLVDELGLKGTRIGGAVVSPEHGNFIVNDGDATAHDILELIAIIRARVKEERGIDLVPEVEIIGED